MCAVIERIFYTVAEAVELVGNDQLFLELIEFHGLRLHTRIKYVAAQQMDDDDFFDSLATSGQHDLSHWTHFVRSEKDEDGEDAHP